MKQRRNLLALTVAIALIALPTLTGAQNAPGPKGKLEGVWNAVLTADEGGFQEAERYTFTVGSAVDDGTLIFSNEVDAVPPCGTDQGVWVRTGSRQFKLTHGAFCVDLSSGAPAFRIKFREAITLNTREDQFSGRGVFEVFDPNGGLLFSATYGVRGTRMAVEGLSSVSEFDDAAALPQADNLTKGDVSVWRRWMKNLQQ